MEDTFFFFVPLEKSEGSSDDERPVSGLASCDERDADGDDVMQKGMDFTPLLREGVINWDHNRVQSPHNVLGRIRTAEIVDPDHQAMRRVGATGVGCFVKGFLWPESYGHAGANETWALSKAMADTGRPLGWSIEGRVRERKGKRITKSEIFNLALTPRPKQRKTFAEIAKSMATGDLGGGGTDATPLLMENLNGKLTSVLWGDGPCEKGCYDSNGRFMKGRAGALEHLVTCKHRSLEESSEFLKAIIKSRIGR